MDNTRATTKLGKNKNKKDLEFILNNKRNGGQKYNKQQVSPSFSA